MDDYKAEIAAKYDVTQILDVLGMDEHDLVDALEDRILENLYLFDIDMGNFDD